MSVELLNVGDWIEFNLFGERRIGEIEHVVEFGYVIYGVWISTGFSPLFCPLDGATKIEPPDNETSQIALEIN